MSDPLAALAAGRAWCGDHAAFGSPGSALDMLVDGTVPMGAASVSGAASRTLALQARPARLGQPVAFTERGELQSGDRDGSTRDPVDPPGWPSRRVRADVFLARGLGEVRAARDLDQDTLDPLPPGAGPDHSDTLGSASNLAEDLRLLGEADDGS